MKKQISLAASNEGNKKTKLSNLKRLCPYIRLRWKEVLLGSIFMLFLSILAVPAPYIMKIIIDKVLGERNVRLLAIMIIILIGIELLRLLFSYLTDYYFCVVSQEITNKIKKDIYSLILRLPLLFFDNHQTGYIQSRVNDVEGLGFFFSSVSIRIIVSIIEFVFCLFVLFKLNVKLTLISISILPILFFMTKFTSRRVRRLARDAYEKGATLAHRIQDSLSGVDVIKTFSAEKRETSKIHNYLDEIKKVNMRRNKVLTLSSGISGAVVTLAGLVILWWSGLDIIKGNFTIGSYFAFSAYVGRLFGPTQMVAAMGLSLQPALVALERVSELMDLDVEDSENKIEIYKINKNIEFKNVFFSYDKKQVLTDISFKIEMGEKFLLSGPNGSGKSTIIKLIMGLYKPNKGLILIDDCDLNSISPPSLRERISIVSQNSFLFNDTIRNNVLYSRPNANDDDLERAVLLSGAYDFIKNLERGFETQIGERGVKLSGGERQKLSIARAILKDSDLIIFDEATAHLDKESERRIDNFVRDQFHDKMCISISHKIGNLNNLGKTIFLEQGRIVN